MSEPSSGRARELSIPDESHRTAASGRVLAGSPTDEELAAVAAVLTSLFESGSRADRPRDVARPRDRWARSQRGLRGVGTDPFGTGFGETFGR